MELVAKGWNIFVAVGGACSKGWKVDGACSKGLEHICSSGWSISLDTYFVVSRATRALSEFFRTRSALAVLDGICNDCVGSVESQLVQIQDERTFAPPAKTTSPLLHLSVKMLPGAFVALQLFQAPMDQAKNLNLRHNSMQVLKEIAIHTSILTGFFSGVDVGILVHAGMEVRREGGQGEAPPPGGAPSDQVPPGEHGCRSRLNTVKVAASVHIPVAQASLSLILLGKEGGVVPSLPSLSPAQSDLNFQLSLATPTTVSGPQPVLCHLLELGTKDVSASCVAQLFRSEVVEEAVLLVEEVGDYQARDLAGQPPLSNQQKVNNRVLLTVSVPHVWCHLAAPLSGIPSDYSTGGLDVLVTMDMLEAWTPGIQALVSTVSKMSIEKTNRERHVVLALLAVANRLPLCPRVCVHVWYMYTVLLEGGGGGDILCYWKGGGGGGDILCCWKGA